MSDALLTTEERKAWRVDRVTWRFLSYLDSLSTGLEDAAATTLRPGSSRDEGVALKAKAEFARNLHTLIENGTWDEMDPQERP